MRNPNIGDWWFSEVDEPKSDHYVLRDHSVPWDYLVLCDYHVGQNVELLNYVRLDEFIFFGKFSFHFDLAWLEMVSNNNFYPSLQIYFRLLPSSV